MALRTSENYCLVHELNAFTPCRQMMDLERMIVLVDKIIRIAAKYFSKGDLERIRVALKYSAWLHRDEYRKDKVTPYLLHLLEVTCMMIDVGIREYRALCPAILHDTVELLKNLKDVAAEDRWQKMRKRLEEIKILFGLFVKKVVDVVTKRPDEAKNGYWVRMIATPTLLVLLYALLIKFPDRTHNMQTLYCIEPADRARKIAETKEWFPELKRKLEETISKLWAKGRIIKRRYLLLPVMLYKNLEDAMAPHETVYT